MGDRWLRRSILILSIAMIGAAAVRAADLRASTTYMEGVKRTAEGGARSIQTSSTANKEDARARYDAAADAIGKWLEATGAAMANPAPTEQVTSAASATASKILQWVIVRNATLGEPVVTGQAAVSAERAIRQALLDISTETTRTHQRADGGKKAEVIKVLRERLAWQPWGSMVGEEMNWNTKRLD